MNRFMSQRFLGYITIYTLLLIGLTPGTCAQSISPLMVYEFDQSSLANNGWREIPGGFTGQPAGSAALCEFPMGAFASTLDDRGLALTVRPNEVVFIHPLYAVYTQGAPSCAWT